MSSRSGWIAVAVLGIFGLACADDPKEDYRDATQSVAEAQEVVAEAEADVAEERAELEEAQQDCPLFIAVTQQSEVQPPGYLHR